MPALTNWMIRAYLDFLGRRTAGLRGGAPYVIRVIGFGVMP